MSDRAVTMSNTAQLRLREKIMLCEMEKAPEYVAISPMALNCPFCKAKPGIACEMLDDMVELIHLERIEAAITLDEMVKQRG
jgi:hypothetical protein